MSDDGVGSSPEPVRHRVAPVLAKAAPRDAHADGRLAALVLVDLQQARYTLHVGARKAGAHDVFQRLIVLHVALDNGIQHLVGRQAVLVGLVRPQLGTGRAGNDALGDGVGTHAIGVVGIAPARTRAS